MGTKFLPTRTTRFPGLAFRPFRWILPLDGPSAGFFMKPSVLPVVVALAAGSLVSCGGGSRVEPTREVSVGQQLSDLDAAYRQGIISEREYKRLKSALIKRYD